MITVSVKQNLFNKGCAPISDIVKYTGTMMKNPSWVDSDHICLTTGDSSFTFRIIKKSNIVDSSTAIMYNAPKSDRNVFEAKGSKGNVYTITREKSTWSCTCVGFGFRRDCKHIAAAKKMK